MDKFTKLLDEITEELNELIKDLGIDKEVGKATNRNKAEQEYEIELSEDEETIGAATELMKMYRALQLVGFTKDEAYHILITMLESVNGR